MATRHANAIWQGNLKSGRGKMKFGSGAFEGQYSFSSRFEEGKGTNPEELIGAAHAGCFSMAFSHGLSEAGFVPNQVSTEAKVHLAMVDGGFKIVTIELECEADIPKIDDATFNRLAEEAKKGCPVSKALTGVDIKLKAKLLKLA
jgi:lipoyl-dependent peroxiredoxin